MTTLHRFPRSARVRSRSEYDCIFKHGRRLALPVLALHWLDETARAALPADACRAPAPTSPRLGLAVSRKVDRRAVGRNRIKRTLREAFREHRAAMLTGDYVIVARPGAAQCDRDALRTALLGLLRRAGALPLPAPPGTMPAAARADAPPAR